MIDQNQVDDLLVHTNSVHSDEILINISGAFDMKMNPSPLNLESDTPEHSPLPS